MEVCPTAAAAPAPVDVEELLTAAALRAVSDYAALQGGPQSRREDDATPSAVGKLTKG